MDRVYEDAMNLLCGALIGEGAHRKVFECVIRKDLVVKVDKDTEYRKFTNVIEMEFWKNNMYNKRVAEWLAPCEYLSPDGLLLLQRRCEGIGRTFLPDKLPKFLTDIKQENFGYFEGRVVCIDYAMTIVNPSTKLIDVKDWR